MTTLSTDTFIRANQSNWGTASDGETWANGAGAAIASNEGTVSGNTFADTAMTLGNQTTKPINFLVRAKITDGNGGPIWRYSDANNYYRAVQENSGTMYLQKRVSGTNSTITSIAIGGFSTSSFFWIRIVDDASNTISVTVWLDGNSEPAPQISTSDTTFTSAGQYGLTSVSYGGGTANSFDHLTVTDNSASVTHLRISDGYGGVFS